MNSAKICNIFYTDDDLDDRELFVDAANDVSESLKILTQDNGDELLELLKNPSSSPNLIFLDLNMPIKNGYEVLRELKESDQTKDLPVIIFSTSDDDNAINTSRSLGANLYIPKPSSFIALKNAIQHILAINWDTFKPSTEDFVFRPN